MAAYPIPNPQYGIYNQNNFSKQPSGQDALTVDTGKLYFLQFPNAQTTQTEFLHSIGVASDATFNGPVTFNETVTYEKDIEYKQNVTVGGDATIVGNFLGETGTFQQVLTCEQGIDISVSPYGITFPDNTTQTTAFIEANYAQLNTDNIFLAPYQQTFAGNSSTGNTTGPIKITNGVVNGGNPEYCTMYLDPSVGYDMTLYSAQSTGGGLTVRSANGASYTLNPVTITSGIVGAQSLNPLDMNGNGLYGLTNVYADGSGMTFIDSANSSMLQLTNGGHTSYENINMNYNDFSNVNVLNFGGNNCKISNESDNNINVLNISNLSPYANNGSIYFEMYGSNGTAFAPLRITSQTAYFTVPIDLNGNKSINNAFNINGTNINASSNISTPVVDISTYSEIRQNSSNNSTVITNTAPYNGANLANVSFFLTNSSGTSTSPLQIYNNSVTANTTLTMSNNDITKIKNLSGNNGADIAISGCNLSLVNNSITGVNTISGFQGANITMGNSINMNNTNIFNCGSLSTGYTQPSSTNNTTLATTAFVKNNIPTVRSFAFTQTSTSSVLQPSPCLTETIQQGTSVQFTNTYFSITIFGFFISAAVLQFDDLPWDTPPPTVSGGQYINGVLQSSLTSYQFYCSWSSTAPWTLTLIPYSGVPTANGSVYAFNLASLGIMTS